MSSDAPSSTEPRVEPSPHELARARRWIVAVFLIGGACQVWMLLRSWVYFDQVLLLRLGLRWAIDRELVAWGKVMSGGGAIPGSALELAVGLPLSLWMHARSPVVLIFLSQLAAGALLVRVLWRSAGAEVALWFAVLYWLSPWRLFHGGFLWEPHFLLLPAAVALWAGFALRPGISTSTGARFGASAALGASVVLAPQLHASGALLAPHSLALLLARRIRPGWTGLVVGGLAGATPLLPALRALSAGDLPPWAPVEGRPFAGLLEVHPLLKSLTLWIRIASAETGRRLLETTFLRDYGGRVDASPPNAAAWWWIGPLAALAVASAVLVAVAQWKTQWTTEWKSPWKQARPVAGGEDEATRWLLSASSWALVVLLGATAVSPVGPQMRYALVFLHFACLPVAVWLARALPRARPRLRVLLLALVLVRLPIALVLGAGHPMYRPPDDPRARARLSGEGLLELEPVPAPFGSGKERELPVFER